MPLKLGYGYDDRGPDERLNDLLEELHSNYKELTPKEGAEKLLDDWMFLKSM